MALESDSTLHEQQLTEQQQKMAGTPANESENQVDGQQFTKEHHIPATFSAQDTSDSDAGEQAGRDPMERADLEAFGGTKKTLERKLKPRQLTPEEVHEQLLELHEIDAKMAEARTEKRSKKGMMETIAWLKKHQHTSDSRRSDQRRLKRSSSFVRSVLGFFQFGDGRHNNRHNKQDKSDNADDNNTSDVDNHALPYLQSPWGQTALNVDWTEIGFALLNQAVLDDIACVRPIVQSEELLSASPQALIALSKWLRRFDQHVDHVQTLKEYLLEERTLLAGVGHKVTTVYDIYKEALGVALEKTHGDRRELGAAILQVFADLETILRDEQLAVKHVVQQALTQDQEYEALSSLFHNLSDDDSCGVVLAKLLGWMKNHMDDDRETQSFLEQFDEDVKDRLAGEWMRQYAIYLELLDAFSVNFEGSMAYFT